MTDEEYETRLIERKIEHKIYQLQIAAPNKGPRRRLYLNDLEKYRQAMLEKYGVAP